MRRIWWSSPVLVAIWMLGADVRAADDSGNAAVVRVCVEIQMKRWDQETDAAPAAKHRSSNPVAPAPVPAAPPTNPPPEPLETEPPVDEEPAVPPEPESLLRPRPSEHSVAAVRSPWLASPGNDPLGLDRMQPLTPTPPDPTQGQDERPADASASGTFEVQPNLYLRRLMEHYVTHEPGFEAVRSGCSQTLTVELYPVQIGWTVFARYSGHAREEKVDRVQLDEFDPLAERLARALLHNRTVSETLTRTTVLRADSETRTRRIRGSTHLMLGLGTALRYGRLPTAPDESAPVRTEHRLQAPLSFTLGTRNKFRAWALDVFARLNLGTTQRASRRNLAGGHADYQAGGMLGLHFVRYHDPDGVNSLYYGGGAAFELSRYTLVSPLESDGHQPSPQGLWGGGLNLDAMLGYEFMRATSLHFFVEGSASMPTYVYHAENDNGSIRAYLPTGLVQVGLLY